MTRSGGGLPSLAASLLPADTIGLESPLPCMNTTRKWSAPASAEIPPLAQRFLIQGDQRAATGFGCVKSAGALERSLDQPGSQGLVFQQPLDSLRHGQG